MQTSTEHFDRETIIQKLHSAVVSNGAKEGYVITTDRFSEEAIEHAKTLSPPIQLIDLPKLIDLGDKANIVITTSGTGKVSLYMTVASDWKSLKTKCNSLFDQFISSPSKPIDLSEFDPQSVDLLPVYVVRFGVNQDFTTTVGKIYSIHADNQSILVSAINGGLIKPEISSFISGSKLHETKELPDFGCPTHRGDFKLDMTSLKNSSKKIITQLYSKNVNYHGSNRRRYTKLCVPSEHSIYIRDTKQVFLPIRQAKLNILKQSYSSIFVESDNGVYYESGKFLVCKICNETLEKEPLLCNSCGKITHKPRFFKHHGAYCHDCGKTICQDCTRKKRYYLILRKRICEVCLNSSSKKT